MKEKIKIALYVFYQMHNVGGGLESVITQLLANFNSDEMEFTLITQFNSINNKYLSMFKNGVIVDSIFNNRHGKFSKKNNILKWRWNFLFKLIKLFYKYDQKIINSHIKKSLLKYDVIIDTDPIKVANVKLKLNSNQIKSKVIGWHHADYNYLINALNKFSLTKIDLLSALDKLILVSNVCKQDIINDISDRNLIVKCETIYNGIDIDNIKKLANAEINSLNEDHQNIIKTKYILMVARLSSQKDHVTLLKAFNCIKDNYPELNLVFLGLLGDTTELIKDTIKNFNLEQRVFIIGAVSNPYVWIKHCLLSVLSTNYEGFGIVITESIALGKSVIVSDIAPCLEAVNNNKAGFSFKTGNINKLVEKLKIVINGEYDKNSLMNNQINFIQQFSISNFIYNFEKILKTYNLK